MRAPRVRPGLLNAAMLLAWGIAACVRSAGPGGSAQFERHVEFSILEDYDKGDDLRDVAKDFELFRELGVTTWRGSFGWDDYEPSRGNYDFDWLHRFADLAAAHGITLRPYIAYTPPWASDGGRDSDKWNDPPRDVEDWYRFVRALVAAMRRHHNIRSYEIYNEENVPRWWDGTAEAYAQVLRRGIAAVRSADPRASVVLGGMVYPDLDWLQTICASGGPGRLVDVIPFHAYPETWTPAGVTLETYLGPAFKSSFVAGADAACGAKRLWVNETGFATIPGRTEADQARWWVRAVATFVSEPRIEQIGIYEIKDLPIGREAIGDTPNYHLGITRADRERKMAFATLRRLVSLLGGRGLTVQDPALSVTVTPAATTVYRHLVRRDDGRSVLFLWTGGSGVVVDVTLPHDAARVREYGVDGRLLTSRPLGDRRRLQAVVLQPGEPRTFELSP